MWQKESMAIEAKLVALAAWMKETYGGTMIQSLKTVLPIKKKEKIRQKRTLLLVSDREEAQKKLDWYLEKNQKARARLLAALLDSPRLEYDFAIKKLNLSAAVVKALEERGILKTEVSQVYRSPVAARKQSRREICYTKEQEMAIRRFREDYDRGERGTYLVHGVTGSGKTEVYMAMIQKAVEKGKQAIVLIPEIALTYQTVMRFQRVFGERVSILNSRMSAGGAV